MTVEVPYNYYISLNVTLTSKPISSVASGAANPGTSWKCTRCTGRRWGNKPLIFGGSANTSDSESLTGVEFVNGTRPWQSGGGGHSQKAGGQCGRPALLELVRL